MLRTLLAAAFPLILSAATLAQTTSRPDVVRASGEASVSAQPDQAKINIGVLTRAQTADEASSRNAIEVESVTAAVRRVLGAAAQIRTLSYSLNPNYIHSSGNPPVIDGYTANNTVEITVEDLSLIGKVIDAAIPAGATNVQGLRFAVQDPEPFRREALSRAAQEAMSNAAAIAAGLNREVGEVLIAQQGSSPIVPVVDYREVASSSAQTPIETGLVVIRATVTVEAELR